MKKSLVFISAICCLMLSSCGTDIDQKVNESSAVVTDSKAVYAYSETAVDAALNAECCTPQTSSEKVLNEESVPDCCVPGLAESGKCCGE